MRGDKEMKKTLMYKDRAGNRLYVEGSQKPKVTVRNAQGKLVTRTQSKRFVNQAIRNKPSLKTNERFKETQRRKKTISHGSIFRIPF